MTDHLTRGCLAALGFLVLGYAAFKAAEMWEELLA